MRVTLADARLVRGDQVVDGWLQTDGATIVAVGTGTPPEADTESLGGRFVLPGFIDIHGHGGGGGSYTSADAAQITRARDFHLAHGTTTAVASLVSDTVDALVTQIDALAPFIDDGHLHGVHLEGPWIARDFCGAHSPDVLRPPTPDEIDLLVAAAGDRIVMVTLAPELDGAIDAVGRLARAGVIVAVGHTAATAGQVRDAIDAGARVATHLFNAMPHLGHRNPGPVGALLSDERVTVEVICDGVHLHPDVLRIVLDAAPDRTVLITDAMAAAGAADGEYVLGRVTVRVADGAARLLDSGVLAGSLLTMDAAVRYAVRDVGVPLPLASAAASTTPARVLGLTDRGVLAPGYRADLVVMSPDLAVERVMLAGEWVGDA